MAAVLPDAALIVRAPGDGLLVDEIKTWEVRGKPTNKIGRIAIAWAGSGCLVGTGARAALKCGSKAAPILMSASTWWQPQRKSSCTNILGAWGFSNIVYIINPHKNTSCTPQLHKEPAAPAQLCQALALRALLLADPQERPPGWLCWKLAWPTRHGGLTRTDRVPTF